MKRILIVVTLMTLASCSVLAQATTGNYKSINLIDTLEAGGNFTTLLTAFQKAGLIETLKGPGPFTLFAPNDAAFAKLPPERLAALMKNPAELKSLLLYHVTAGNLTIKDLQGRADRSVTMMGANKTYFSCDASSPNSQTKVEFQCNASPTNSQPKVKRDGNSVVPPDPQSKVRFECDESPASKHTLVLNGTANVIMADLGASNGMIHVIDAVLGPITLKPPAPLAKPHR